MFSGRARQPPMQALAALWQWAADGGRHRECCGGERHAAGVLRRQMEAKRRAAPGLLLRPGAVGVLAAGMDVGGIAMEQFLRLFFDNGTTPSIV